VLSLKERKRLSRHFAESHVSPFSSARHKKGVRGVGENLLDSAKCKEYTRYYIWEVINYRYFGLVG
jgi:hypothetical protein